jgi:hypothetical protein
MSLEQALREIVETQKSLLEEVRSLRRQMVDMESTMHSVQGHQGPLFAPIVTFEEWCCKMQVEADIMDSVLRSSMVSAFGLWLEQMYIRLEQNKKCFPLNVDKSGKHCVVMVYSNRATDLKDVSPKWRKMVSADLEYLFNNWKHKVIQGFVDWQRIREEKKQKCTSEELLGHLSTIQSTGMTLHKVCQELREQLVIVLGRWA